MSLLSHYSTLVNKAAATAVSDYHTYPASLAGLYEPISYTIDSEGKRLRPTLCLLTATGYGMEAETAMPAAIAIEMFHNFTLVHDDVMDASPTRRGKPSVQARWGIDTAILSGDTMLSLCYRMLLAMEIDEKLRYEALSRFTRHSIEVYEGQQLDMDFEKRAEVSEQEYLEMIRLKTSVLLGAACAMGAVISGADEHEQTLLYKYGEMLGLAFQIQDDILDVYADPKTFGKPIGGDILNAKKSLPMILARRSAYTSELDEAMALPADQSRIEAVRAIYDKANIRLQCDARIKEYTDMAIKYLKESKIADTHKAELSELALSLISRNK